MSYILDALKKSEQERGTGTVPGVQTVHSSSLNYRQEKNSVWPWLVAALVGINIIAVTYFIYSQDEQIITATAQPVIQQIPLASEPPVKTDPMPVIATIPTQTRIVEEETIVQSETIEPVFEAVDFYDLPLNVRQYIPAMEFSAHVYSSNPLQRSIVINGRFMEEGSFMNNELMLTEITSDGAVFDFQGYRFNMSVLSGWE